ncbi:MAG: citrate synthase [Hyphomicrobiales bacterium]|nr:citrate synthase [Hyphomicrobiales bacterium]
MAASSPLLSRDAALAILGVRPQTLYAYVSRGLIRMQADPGEPRRSLYLRHDIEALVARKKRSRRRADIASSAIAWGEPVLESAISTVRDGRLVFRGQDAAALSSRASLEDVAAVLWNCAAFDPPAKSPPIPRNAQRGGAASRALAALGDLAARQQPIVGRGDDRLVEDARATLYAFVDAIAERPGSGRAHERIAAGWKLDARGADLVRRALALIADHELNASTFAVRVAASTGAPLAAAALAGFCALLGPLHGGAIASSLDLLDRMMASRGQRAFARAAIARGERFLGFGHPLYPLGDMRALALRAAMKPPTKIARALDVAADEVGRPPNIDIMLAALTRQLALPDDAPLRLFAAGRMAGWLAHAMEQGRSGRLIRPRARYIGV